MHLNAQTIYKYVSRYLTVLTSRKMTRKPKGVKVTSFSEPVDQAHPIEERHRHTCYVTQGSHLRASHSIVTTQPPTDARSPTSVGPVAGQGNLPDDFDPNNGQFPFPWMDPTYIDNSDLVGEVETSARKRTRTLAVVRMWYLIHRLIIHMVCCRRTHYYFGRFRIAMSTCRNSSGWRDVVTSQGIRHARSTGPTIRHHFTVVRIVKTLISTVELVW